MTMIKVKDAKDVDRRGRGRGGIGGYNKQPRGKKSCFSKTTWTRRGN